MKKLKAIRLLDALREEQYQDELNTYTSKGRDWEYRDFITVYYNIGVMKDLRYCNTVNEALEIIEALPSIAKIALEVGDEFKD